MPENRVRTVHICIAAPARNRGTRGARGNKGVSWQKERGKRESQIDHELISRLYRARKGNFGDLRVYVTVRVMEILKCCESGGVGLEVGAVVTIKFDVTFTLIS